MKRLNFILGAAALAAVAMTASPVINAQENGNRDENGKIVRGPYETNRFGDNWFIGVGGGVNFLWSEGYEGTCPPFFPSSRSEEARRARGNSSKGNRRT